MLLAVVTSSETQLLKLPDGSSSVKCVPASPITIARENNCLYATNGAYFEKESEQCLGTIIHAGHVVQVDSRQKYPSMSLSRTGKWFIGYFSEAERVAISGGIIELVTGRGWLIRSGSSTLELSISKLIQLID